MTREHKRKFKSDVDYEGKSKAALDVDRYINEGLSGGSVHMRDAEHTNIEEAHDFPKEDPPQ